MSSDEIPTLVYVGRPSDRRTLTAIRIGILTAIIADIALLAAIFI